MEIDLGRHYVRGLEMPLQIAPLGGPKANTTGNIDEQSQTI